MVYLQRAIFRFLVLFLLTIHLRILSLQKKHLLVMNHRPYQKQSSQNIPPLPKDPPPDFPPCPGKNDQRVGDFRNDKKLERVIGHERGQDGSECITLYEAVEWKEQYIPSAPQFVGVFSLALVGASAPLVLQLVRPLVKQVVTKLTKKRK